jgi:class 3 adenylate cyclase
VHVAGGSSKRLAAVWFADIVGYTSLSTIREREAIRLVNSLHAVAQRCVRGHGGRVVKFVGDAVVAEFQSVEGAIHAAVALRQAFAERASDARLRIGVHLGEITIQVDGDIYGDGVNVAARVQGVAEPGQIVVSADVWKHARQIPSYEYTLLGDHALKGLEGPIRLYSISSAAVDTAALGLDRADSPPLHFTFQFRWRRLAVSFCVLSLAVFAITPSGIFTSASDTDGSARTNVLLDMKSNGSPLLDTESDAYFMPRRPMPSVAPPEPTIRHAPAAVPPETTIPSGPQAVSPEALRDINDAVLRSLALTEAGEYSRADSVLARGLSSIMTYQRYYPESDTLLTLHQALLNERNRSRRVCVAAQVAGQVVGCPEER